ncbi:hypothetical protein BASA81_000633 [Batrachochytrium salamandrivorans]|nr:hypothetical protein BASA81_000633 [Batrachochytrium salamandrivorans]
MRRPKSSSRPWKVAVVLAALLVWGSAVLFAYSRSSCPRGEAGDALEWPTKDPATRLPLPRSPIQSITRLKTLECNSLPPSREFEQQVLLPVLRQANHHTKWTFNEFVCLANCSASEPELDFAFRYLGNKLSKIQAKSLSVLCERGRVPVLIRISDSGQVEWTKCPTGDKLKATHQLFVVLRAVFVLASTVRLRKGLVWGFDNSDFSRPEAGDPHGLHWMYTEPGLVRFVGDATHPSLLWPTTPYWKQTAYCSFDEPGGNFEWLERGLGCRHQHRAVPWFELKDEVFWRGSPTGYPIDDLHVDFMPRSLLNREFSGRPGYDVSFAKDAVPPYANQQFIRQHVWLPRAPRSLFTNHKMIVSIDGHTASWGLIERLGTGSLLLVVDSLRLYREFYYKLLVPWEHFAPVAFDLSNMESIRVWALAHPQLAQRMASQASKLVDERMRAQDTWCYLLRLVDNLASKQAFDSNDAAFDGFLWQPVTRHSVQTYASTFT